MDNLLIPAALVLIVTNLVFAWLANHWRTQAKAHEHAAMQMACDLARVARDSHDAAWAECRRHTMGLLYKIATRADREGRDAFAALREVSAQSESVVQVPESA